MSGVCLIYFQNCAIDVEELRYVFRGEEVVVNGAAKEIGRAAVVAVTRARGMELAGAVDSYLVGEDIGKVSPSRSLPFPLFFNTNICVLSCHCMKLSIFYSF